MVRSVIIRQKKAAGLVLTSDPHFRAPVGFGDSQAPISKLTSPAETGCDGHHTPTQLNTRLTTQRDTDAPIRISSRAASSRTENLSAGLRAIRSAVVITACAD